MSNKISKYETDDVLYSLVLQFGFVIREVGAVRIKDTKRIIIRHVVNLRESALKLMLSLLCFVVLF